MIFGGNHVPPSTEGASPSATFAVGAAVPLIVVLLAPLAQIGIVVAATTLVALAVLGASAGGAGILKGAVRVTFGGALAMAATAGVGMMFGVAA